MSIDKKIERAFELLSKSARERHVYLTYYRDKMSIVGCGHMPVMRHDGIFVGTFDKRTDFDKFSRSVHAAARQSKEKVEAMRNMPDYLREEVERAWRELDSGWYAVTLRLTPTGKILGFMDEDEDGVVIGTYNQSIPINVLANDVMFVYEQIMNNDESIVDEIGLPL